MMVSTGFKAYLALAVPKGYQVHKGYQAHKGKTVQMEDEKHQEYQEYEEHGANVGRKDIGVDGVGEEHRVREETGVVEGHKAK